MDFAPPINMQLTCRFQQESIIWFLDLLSLCLTILISLLLVVSLGTVVYYKKISLPKHIEHAYEDDDGMAERILNCKPEEKEGLQRLFFFVSGPKQEKEQVQEGEDTVILYHQTGKYFDLLRAKNARDGGQQPLIAEPQRSDNEMQNVVETT